MARKREYFPGSFGGTFLAASAFLVFISGCAIVSERKEGEKCLTLNKVDVCGRVFGRRLNGELVPLEGAKVYLDSAVRKGFSLKGCAGRKGLYCIRRVPEGKYWVLVFHPKMIKYSGIEALPLYVSGSIKDEKGKRTVSKIRKDFILNETPILKVYVFEKDSRNPIKNCVVHYGYKRLKNTNEGYERMPQSEFPSDYACVGWADNNGLFRIPLYRNSIRKDFQCVLGEVMCFDAPGFEDKYIKKDWVEFLKSQNGTVFNVFLNKKP